MDRRNAHVDVLRGILIVLVVVGHSKTDILHWFQVPDTRY